LRNLEKCPECLQRFHVEWLGNLLLKEIGPQRLEELLNESMSKNESSHNKLEPSPHERNESIKELRKIAKEKNIKGYSKMKKTELLQKIGEQPSAIKPFVIEDNYFTELFTVMLILLRLTKISVNR
jgi:hypothetical protein